MQIVKIEALYNGAHENQNGGISYVPEGWAVVPPDLETPNFPFGEMVVEDVDGVQTVTGWTAGDIPDTPDPAPTELDILRSQLAEMDDTCIELYEANEAQQAVNEAQDEALIELYELIGG
jgi:hypothetical protein